MSEDRKPLTMPWLILLCAELGLFIGIGMGFGMILSPYLASSITHWFIGR